METVETGWNTLVGVDPDAFGEALVRPVPCDHPSIFGDGRAAEQIAALCLAHLDGSAEQEVSYA